MAQKECPHCGNVLPARAHACGCGYDFPKTGTPLLGSKAARDISAKLSKPAPAKPAKPRKKKARRREPEPEPAAGGDSLSSMLIACPSCPAKISRRAERCPKCGKSPLAKCQICKNEIRANSAACPECGDPDPFNA